MRREKPCAPAVCSPSGPPARMTNSRDGCGIAACSGSEVRPRQHEAQRRATCDLAGGAKIIPNVDDRNPLRGTGGLHPTRSIPESDAPASVEDCDTVGEECPAHPAAGLLSQSCKTRNLLDTAFASHGEAACPVDRALLSSGRRRKSAPDQWVRLWFSPRRKPKSLRRNRFLSSTFGIAPETQRSATSLRRFPG